MTDQPKDPAADWATAEAERLAKRIALGEKPSIVAAALLAAEQRGRQETQERVENLERGCATGDRYAMTLRMLARHLGCEWRGEEDDDKLWAAIRERGKSDE